MKNNNIFRNILAISTGFLIVYLIAEWTWCLYISLIVGLAGVFSTYLSKKIDFVWLKLAGILGFIIPNILLSIIFFLILFPVAMISRLFSKRNNLQLSNNSNSLFVDFSKTYDRISIEKPW